MNTNQLRSISLAAVVGLSLAAAACKRPSPGKDAKAEAGAAQTDGGSKKTADKPVRTGPNASGNLLPMPDDVVAKVGKLEVTRAEFDAVYQPQADALLARRNDGQIPDAWEAMQRRKIIGDLVWSKLLQLEAERLGIDYDPEALAEQEARERTDVADWEAWLARVNQTVESRHQANVDYFRARAIIEHHKGPLVPTEDEMKAAYEANAERYVAGQPMLRASHLLFAYGPREPGQKIQPATLDMREAASEEERATWRAASLERAKAMRAKVLEPGVDFNDFAKIHSEGPGAFRGGDMGLFPREQMIKAYSDAAVELEVGEISEPVESDMGYYVIKLFGRYEAGPLPFEAVRADLLRDLEAQRLRDGRTALYEELKERFPVESPVLDEAESMQRPSGPPLPNR